MLRNCPTFVISLNCRNDETLDKLALVEGFYSQRCGLLLIAIKTK